MVFMVFLLPRKNFAPELFFIHLHVHKRTHKRSQSGIQRKASVL